MGQSSGEAWIVTLDRLPPPRIAANHVRLSHLSSALAALGFRVQVVSLGDRIRPVEVQAWEVQGGIAAPNLNCRAKPLPVFDLVSCLSVATPWLIRRAHRRRPRLVVSTSAAYATALTGLRRVGVMTWSDVMGIASLEVRQSGRTGLRLRAHELAWRRLERIALQASSLVTTVNAAHSEWMASAGLVKDAKILRDACDPMDRGVSENDERWLRSVIPNDRVTVAFVGSIVNRRLDDLMHAWSGIVGRRRATLVIAGSGRDEERYRDLVRRHGLGEGSVVFLGHLAPERARAVISYCDIGYSDCWSDLGFPMKVFEYMAMAKPIVVARKPQIFEVLTEGTSALAYQGGDELRLILTRLIDDVRLRSRLGAAAHDTWRSGHTWAHRTQEVARLLGHCLDLDVDQRL